MAMDWTSKDTARLKLILDSLKRYQGNAKTDREKRNSARSIEAIEKILKERKHDGESISKI